jgi:TatD DNase family protein
MFIDSHCHLNYPEFTEDMDQIMKRAADVGIHKMLTICTELSDAQPILDLANSRDELSCSVGVHPHEAKAAVDAGQLYEGLKHFTQYKKVVALGETGLDYYYEHSPKAEQQEAFKTHIRLAKETGLPLIVHTRDAEEDTIDMLKAEQGHITGVIHCFSGTQWLSDQALALGFYISISGIATFNKAQDIRDTIKTVPLDRLLLETDAPYLAPVPKRGKRNEPSFMIYTAQTVADLKGVSMEELARVTTANYERLFNKETL